MRQVSPEITINSNRLRYFILSILCLLTLSIASCSRDCAVSDEVSVEVPVEHDWLFFGKGPFKLAADVTGNEFRTIIELSIKRDLDLMDTTAAPILEKSIKLRTKPGESVRTMLPLGKLAPGFYQIKINENKPFNIGVNPEQIQSPADTPADFDEFWETTISELNEVPLEVKWTLIPEHSSAVRECYRVEIPSFGGATMGGIIFIPTAEGRYPVMMGFMGYGANVYYEDPDYHADRIDYLVSVRDQGIFKGNQDGWIDRGLASKEDFYYRGAFCDIVRSVEFAAGLPKADTTRIFGCGDSQGGAFTWISAALTDRMRAITPGVPFLSDYPDYARIVNWPMQEVFRHADAEGIPREQLMEMLRYFDVKNFASRITCPAYMAFGLQDPTCPPHTNFAGYNNVKSEKHYFCAPRCGHGIWEISEWIQTRDAFFSKYQ